MKIDSNNSHLKFESIQRKKKTQEIKDRARDSFGETKIERKNKTWIAKVGDEMH